jgi:hypothetical protein
VALHKWERKAGPWLSVIVAKMLAADGGYRVVVADGTSLSRPDAMGTAARIHYAVRLPGLEIVYCTATSVSGGETLRHFDVQPGELWIGDRVFGTPPGVASVCGTGGDVLVRINKTNLPLFTGIGERIAIDAELTKVAARDQPVERAACVHGHNGQIIQGRLCILWLTESAAKSARACPTREARRW